MNDQTLYIKRIDKSNIEESYTKAAYHLQEARKHLEEVSTASLANQIGLTKQGLQRRIDAYKKEVAK